MPFCTICTTGIDEIQGSWLLGARYRCVKIVQVFIMIYFTSVRYMCACAVDIGLEYALIRIGCCVGL